MLGFFLERGQFGLRCEDGVQVSRILDLIFRVHVPRFEAEKLVHLLAFLSSLAAASTDVWLQQTAKQLECSLKRYYIVHALQKGRTDRVLEFFQQYGEGLLRSGDRDWLVWFGELPFLLEENQNPNLTHLVIRSRIGSELPNCQNLSS
jgi:hypothetical protein